MFLEVGILNENYFMFGQLETVKNYKCTMRKCQNFLNCLEYEIILLKQVFL